MNKTEKAGQKLLFSDQTVRENEDSYKQGQKMFEALAAMLMRPIIGHQGWEKDITQEQKSRIKIERLKQIAQSKGKITDATDYEALVYLSTASLAAPMDSEYTKIFQYLFQEIYPDKLFEEKMTLSEWEQSHLKRLKEWLYKTSMRG